MYSSGKNKNGTVIVQIKLQLETFALLAKKDTIVMACIMHNRTNKSVGEILTDRYS